MRRKVFLSICLIVSILITYLLPDGIPSCFSVKSAAGVEGIAIQQGTFYDELAIERYRWSYNSEVGMYSINLYSQNISWLLESGKLKELVDQYGSSLYVEIKVKTADQIIPKEFFNTLSTAGCRGYIFVSVGGEVYDWGFGTSQYRKTSEDFSPYVTFSKPDRYQEAYGENAAYLQLETSYHPETCGFAPLISLTSFKVGNTIYGSNEYFDHFFERYVVDAVKWDETAWGYRGYFYNEWELSFLDEIGFFYATQFDSAGKKQMQWRECIWDCYYYKTSREFETVEFHELSNLKTGTFVISDSLAIGNTMPGETEAPKSTEQPKSTEVPKSTQQPKSTEQPKRTEVPKSTQQPDILSSTAPGGTGAPNNLHSTEPVIKETASPSQEPAGKATRLSGKLKGLKGTVTNQKAIRLHWSNKVTGSPAKLLLYRKVSGKNSFQKIKAIPVSKRQYLDRKLKKGKKYTYKMVCQNRAKMCVESTAAVSNTIFVPYLSTPVIRIKKIGGKTGGYLKIKIRKYEGTNAEIYLSQNGNDFKKVVLKNTSIRNYHGNFLLRYQKSMGTIYCKVRTWKKRNGNKKYSQYSAVKQIKLT